MEAVVVIAVVIVLGGAVYAAVAAAVRSAKQKAARRSAALAAMGFAPVDAPDPALVARVAALAARSEGGTLELRKTHRMDVGGLECYMFDLWRIGRENDCIEADAVAVVVPRLCLPRFAAIPRADLGGFLGRLLDALVAKLMARSMPRVDFDSYPDFASRYTVGSDDEPALRRVLSGDILNRLGQTSFYHIEGGGDTVILSRLRVTPGRDDEPETELAQSVKDAVWLAGALRKNAIVTAEASAARFR